MVLRNNTSPSVIGVLLLKDSEEPLIDYMSLFPNEDIHIKMKQNHGGLL
jgi:hypothetical protein